MAYNNSVNTIKTSFLNPHLYLKYLTRGWVLVALIGQWIFAVYIFVQFGSAALSGSPTSADTSGMIQGYTDGDDLGNAILALHLLPAILLSLSGTFQIIPYIRRRYPVFHRWNGRMFLTLGILGALTGLYLTWVRGSRLSDLGSIGLTLNGLLIPLAAVLAWRFAVKRQYQNHMRWAVHSFILINGVWSFRLYLMSWFLVNQGPNGNTATIDGPADIALSFASYLLPMLIAEIYFWAMRQKSILRISIINLFMLLGLIITIIGVIAATMFMWLPAISN
ncbi:MAG: DUF2306 domain-containing protein [Kangiellaceae bacterium]|nr:DUF2306 domain-containing protein [Kangiellaceae bacterium]